MRKSYFSITADRVIRPARITKDIKAWAADAGIKIKRAKVGDSSKIAIHLLEPEQFELEAALERAERDSFPAIYLHTFKTWKTYKEDIRRLKRFPGLRLVASNA